ncbi:MAG: hypothetical protein AAGG46_09590, partial [Planctomycetota bacterium]
MSSCSCRASLSPFGLGLITFLVAGLAAPSVSIGQSGPTPAEPASPSQIEAGAEPETPVPAGPASTPTLTPEPPPTAPGFTAAAAAASTPTRQQSRSNRLASAPEMFGDFLFASEAVLIDVGTAQTTGVFPIGGLGMKIGDNNSPLPRDRVFYRLNYFNNAIRTTQVINNAATFSNSASLAQHTVGFEKTLFDGLASVELRSAFANRVDIVDSNPFDISTADLELSAGGEGNLFVVTKFLMLETDSAAWSAGLGIEAP